MDGGVVTFIVAILIVAVLVFVAILSLTVAFIINDTVASYRRGATLKQINTYSIINDDKCPQCKVKLSKCSVCSFKWTKNRFRY